MKIAFYFVDEKYIDFLKEKEINSRGFTTVPNVIYANRSKFLYGAVLNIDGINYLVPVSSYTKKQQDNILIKISDHHKEKIVGSLRFNYMIPVPDKCLIAFDFKHDISSEQRRVFVEKEYRFCKSKLSAIQKAAKKTYQRVVNAADENLVKNSCHFKLLEQAYREYIDNHLTVNPDIYAMQILNDGMRGEADKIGLEAEEDINDLTNDIRTNAEN